MAGKGGGSQRNPQSVGYGAADTGSDREPLVASVPIAACIWTFMRGSASLIIVDRPDADIVLPEVDRMLRRSGVFKKRLYSDLKLL